jgi:hypothetical protein
MEAKKMRKRWLVVAMTATVMALLVVMAVREVNYKVVAQEDRVIPITALSLLPDDTSKTIGDACSFAPDLLRYYLTEPQIVVTDETGTIVAMRDILGEIERASSGSLTCVADFDIPVPDVEFYTVYIGDERVVGYRQDEFPVDPFKEVWINFD